MKSVRVVRVLLGVVLIFSGITKIVDPSKAVDLMLEFKVIPEALILIIISVLPVLEILTGMLLVTGMYPKLASISALALFFGFFLISIYGTIIGLNSDCGCKILIINNGLSILWYYVICQQLQTNNSLLKWEVVMRKNIFSKAIILLSLISMMISATGIICSFIKPEEAYAMPLPLPGKSTTFYEIKACECPKTSGADCICLIHIPLPIPMF